MMWLSRALFAGSILCLSTWAAVVTTTQHADGYWQSRLQVSVGAPPAGCAEATTYIARLTTPSANDITALTGMICGLVTDGLITGDLSTTGCGTYFDLLYFLGQSSAANAVLNICGTSYTLTPTSGPAFTTNRGYTGVGGSSTVYLQTGFNPATASGRVFLQDSNHLACWTNADYTPAAGEGACTGLFDAGLNRYMRLFPKVSTNTVSMTNTGSTSALITVANTDASGFYVGTRTSSTLMTAYKNGASIGTSGATSAIQANGNLPILIQQNAATTGYSNGTPGQLSFFSAGLGLNSTQNTNLYNRVGTARTVMGM